MTEDSETSQKNGALAQDASASAAAKTRGGAERAGDEFHMEFERVPASLQQEEAMLDGLRVLAAWLLRRVEREERRKSETAEDEQKAA